MERPTANTAFYRAMAAFDGAVRRTPDEAAAAHALADDLVRDAEPHAPAACQAGCTYCCHFPVGVRAEEARRIAAELLRPERGPVLERLETVIRERALATAGRSFAELAALQLPCALLTDDGRCAVYSVRPLPCRGWKSSCAQACARAFADRTAVPIAFLDGVAYASALGVGAAWDNASAARGEEPTVRELHAAVVESLDAMKPSSMHHACPGAAPNANPSVAR